MDSSACALDLSRRASTRVTLPGRPRAIRTARPIAAQSRQSRYAVIDCHFHHPLRQLRAPANRRWLGRSAPAYPQPATDAEGLPMPRSSRGRRGRTRMAHTRATDDRGGLSSHALLADIEGGAKDACRCSLHARALLGAGDGDLGFNMRTRRSRFIEAAVAALRRRRRSKSRGPRARCASAAPHPLARRSIPTGSPAPLAGFEIPPRADHWLICSSSSAFWPPMSRRRQVRPQSSRRTRPCSVSGACCKAGSMMTLRRSRPSRA